MLWLTCRILFIGDGMTTNMITAARLLGHKVVNGQYTSRLTLDKPDAYGSQMSHSLDSFITDSANSATALYSGKKMTVRRHRAIWADLAGERAQPVHRFDRQAVHGAQDGDDFRDGAARAWTARRQVGRCDSELTFAQASFRKRISRTLLQLLCAPTRASARSTTPSSSSTLACVVGSASR